MPSAQNAVNNHEYRNIPITVLVESTSNPRKRFDEKSIEEMRELVLESAKICPFNAIIVKDAEGNVIWPLA